MACGVPRLVARGGASENRWADRASVLRAAVCAVFLAGAASPIPSHAQTAAPGILIDGNAVVSGFSGARPPAQVRSGIDPAAMTAIDLNGAALRLIDLQAPGAPPQAQVVFAPKPFTLTAGQIGQVFAIALDNATPPNIYAAATSAYGLPIVVPDDDKDGLPDRAEEGTANAYFMPGLFGPAALGGGPGSIWRIDGATGAVKLFANVMLDGAPNAGPALGGLAFDPTSSSLIVADRETGMIHRFDLAGTERGRYDHGTTGRRAAGLAPLPFDPAKRPSIKRPPFQPANPDSWGLAPQERRVFGLAVRDGRLYYAIAHDRQIWSVSIARDGAFGSDARIELAIPPGQGASEIAKIAFDDQGRMLLAERVAPTGAFDFVALTEEGGGRVLRYTRAGQAWQPAAEEYAVGFAAQMRGGNGGAAVGHGFDAAGRLDRNACAGFVWTTGEQLRAAQDRTMASQLTQRGPVNVNGVQGRATDRVQAPGAPALDGYFVDFDDRFDDPKARGHMGDIAVFRACAPGAVAAVPPPAVAAAPPGMPGVPLQMPGAPIPAAPLPIPPLAAPAPMQVPPGMLPGQPPAPLGQPIGQPPAQPPGQPPAAPGQVAGQPLGQQVVPGQVVGQIQPPQPAGQVVGQEPAPPPGAPPAPPVPQGPQPPQPQAPPPAATVTQGAALPPAQAPMAPQVPPGVAIAPAAPTVEQGSQLPAAGGKIVGEIERVPKMVVGGITISKAGPIKCFPGKPCVFHINIRGATSVPTGVFEVADVPPPGWMFDSAASGPHWNCKSPTDCTYNVTKNPNWPKGGLTAQSTWLMIKVAFRVPSNAPDGVVKNCITATFPPAPGQSNKTIAVDCWEVEVVNPPNLTVTKSLDKGTCAPGEQCNFKITVKNTGGAPYKGFLVLTDTALPQEFEFQGVSTSGSDSSGIKCDNKNLGDLGLFNCYKSSLAEGKSFVVTVKAKLKSSAVAAETENCAKLWTPSDPNDPMVKGSLFVRHFLDFQGYSTANSGPLTADEKKAIADYKKKNQVKDAQGKPDTSGDVTDAFLKSILPSKPNADDFAQSCVKLKTREQGLLVYKEPHKPADWAPDDPWEPGKKPTCYLSGGIGTQSTCGFTIKVSGRDEAPFTKPIQIEDQFPQGFWYSGFKTHGKAQWSCSGQYTKAVCTHPPANLTSKDLLEVTVFATLSYENLLYWGYLKPLKSYPEITNCVKVIYDNPKQYDQEPKLPPAKGQVHPGRHWQACYKQKLAFSDHNIADYDATGSGPCYPPNCSHYDFTIRSGDRYGRGPLTQRITPPSGSAMPDIRVIQAPPSCPASRWSCTRTGAGPAGEFTCHIDDCALNAGEKVITRLEGSVAPDLKEPPPAPIQKTACGALEWDAPSLADSIEQQSTKQIKVACASIMVLARPPAQPLAPSCAAGYTLLPSGICCLESHTTVGGQCCPAGYQPDAYRQSCVAAAASAPPTMTQPQTQPWQTILPGLLQTMPGRTPSRPSQPPTPYPQPPTAPTPSVATPASPPPPAPSSPPAQILPPQPLQATPAQPAIQCTGGKVPVGGQCVCPSGTTEMRGLCAPTGASSSPQMQQMQPGLLRVKPN